VEKPKRARTKTDAKTPCWRGRDDPARYTPGVPAEVPQFKKLGPLFSAMSCCTRCDLARGRTQVVHGVGPKQGVEVMLIGEAPGRQEDERGEPFVGSAGRMLDSLLQRAKLDRETVFITNIVACRPPGNRAPKVSEIKAHAPWMNLQIALVEPLLIVTLGRSALLHFLPKEKITAIHGKPRKVEREDDELWILPTFHPAAAFRNQDVKPLLEADFAAIAPALRRLRRGSAPL
jgi:DNA polymerase